MQIDSGELQLNVPTPLTFSDILSARRQVVAGTKWHMIIETFGSNLKYYHFLVEVVDAPFAAEPLTLVNVQRVLTP